MGAVLKAIGGELLQRLLAAAVQAFNDWRQRQNLKALGAEEVRRDAAEKRADQAEQQAQSWADRPRDPGDLANRLRDAAERRRSGS
jgi:uncharacterized protein YkwD